MKKTLVRIVVASCLAPMLSTCTMAVELLSSSDFIIAIDVDVTGVSNSAYPGGEPPFNAFDGNSGTKYLNFGKLNTGFIASPFTPGTIVQSLQLTTANDEPQRDPLTYDLYGTNDTIMSLDNSFGDQENWSLISSGLTGLGTDPGRFLPGTVQSFSNSTAYNSYRVVFPTVRDAPSADSMQLSEFDLFTSSDGSGSSVLGFVTPLAIGLDQSSQAASPGGQGPEILVDDFGNSQSFYPGNEEPLRALDGDTATKYLNFGKENSGFIITPSAAAQVQSFKLTTANDFEGRDPASFEIYGTNSPIASGDNSFGTGEAWTLLDSGSLALPAARETAGVAVSLTNASSFSSYKMLFPTVKDPGGFLVGATQFAEVEFFTGANGTGSSVLSPTNTILAIDEDALLGTQTTHVNFGEENSGFIVTPAAGSSVVNEFAITTGGDEPQRDPTSWQLYGTNDSITSEAFSLGDQENWVLIDSGTFDVASELGVSAEITLDRNTTGNTVSVTNSTAYSSYRMVFPTVRDEALALSLQLADIQFFGDLVASDNADFDGDGAVDGNDFLIWQRGLNLLGQTNNQNGDADNNGVVNGDDLAIWQAQHGGAPPLAASVGAVPEPTTAVLAVFGLIGASTVAARRVVRGRTSLR